MRFLIALPIIFVAYALYEALKYVKSKFWIKVVKLILIIAIIYFLIEYINYKEIDFTKFFKF